MTKRGSKLAEAQQETKKKNGRETVEHGNAAEEALNIRWVLADITIMQLWT
jgi:hypothetical protein